LMVYISHKGRKKSLFWSSIIIILSIIFYVVVLRPQQQYYREHHVDINGTYLIKPLMVPDFALMDNSNQAFTRQNLLGHWTLLFFGFTHCEMVCPISLSTLNAMYRQLEKTLPPAQLPQVVFVTIDPERDTQKELDLYVTNFNSHFIAARTSSKKTLALESDFHVESNKTTSNKSGSAYSINHSSEILLINPDAKIQAYFRYPPHTELLVKDYNSIISSFRSPKT
jgi:protein SCO1/2